MVTYKFLHTFFGNYCRQDAKGSGRDRTSVVAVGNSKACRNLLKAFAEIHNSLRSDNGFLLITQIPTNQEFLYYLHMKSELFRSVGLGCG